MAARFSAYPPDQPTLTQILDAGTTYRIGRVKDCELCIEHQSVSRNHAELVGVDEPSPEWKLHDVGSKNGLRVGGHLTLKARFSESAWFAVGDVYCSLELLDAENADRLRRENVKRRVTSRRLAAQLTSKLDIGTLIPQALDVVLELSGLQRGFVLYAPKNQPLRIRASRGLDVSDLTKASFNGSASAVERALARRRSVVCCDTNDSPWLGLRPSVRLGGIRALVCVPLQLPAGGIGAIYADSTTVGPAITDLDLDLIENVANHTTSVLAAGALQGEVDALLASAEEIDELAPRWDELRML